MSVGEQKPTLFANETWGIVELMGHQQIAGRLSEVSIAGCNMLRVDIPDKDDAQKFRTVVHGGSSIYGIHFTDEQVARMASAARSTRPAYEYSVKDALERLELEASTRRRSLPTGSHHDDDDDDGD